MPQQEKQHGKKYQMSNKCSSTRDPTGTQGPSPSPGAAIMMNNAADHSPSAASSPDPQQHETPPESGYSSDYGFAGSWPSIPLPSSPGDVAARVMAAAETPGTANASTAEEGRMRGHGASGPCAGAGDYVRPVEDISSLRRGAADDKGGGACGIGGLSSTGGDLSYCYRQIHTGDNIAAPATDRSPEEVASAAQERRGREDSDVSMSSSKSCPMTWADSGNFGYSVGFNTAAGLLGEYSCERSSSRPREQVSLPEDIYGAARVSEYWHGMHALSSLASAYVYDDIWAGDGGLNPREDLIGQSTWATGGGAAATSQERGGGGEAATETGERSSNPGAGGRVSAAMLPRTWSRGSDLGQEGANGKQEDSSVAGTQHAAALTKSWNSGGGNRECGRGGCDVEGAGNGAVQGEGTGQPPSEREYERRSTQEPTRVWDHRRAHVDGGDVDAGVRGQQADGISRERRGVRRRRTLSPGGNGSSGYSSASGDEVLGLPSVGVRSDVKGGGSSGSSPEPARAQKHVGNCRQDETAERHPKRVASPNSGRLLSTTPSTNAAGAPAVGNSCPGAVGSTGNCNSTAADGRMLDSQPTKLADTSSRSPESTIDAGRGWYNGTPLAGYDRANDPYLRSWDTPPISIAPGVPAAAVSASGPDTSGDDEAFFAKHALEPKPRPGWNREDHVDGEGVDPTAGSVVAQSMTAHGLEQGIEVPRWGQHTQIHGSDEMPAPGASPNAASAAWQTSKFHCSPLPAGRGARDCGDGNYSSSKFAGTVSFGSGDGKGPSRWASSGDEAALLGRAAAASGAAAASVDSNFEWQVHPESTAAYFTSVIGLVPPLGAAPQMPANPLPIPNNDGAQGAGGGGEERRDYSKSEAGANDGEGTRSNAAAAEDNEDGPDWETAAASTSRSCSRSCSAIPVDSGASEEGTSWGW